MAKIIVSLITLAIVTAMLSGSAFAILSDSEVSADNTFAAGTLDLTLKDQDEFYYGNGVTASWSLTNMKPGDTINGWVRLRNEGCTIAEYLDISVSNEVIDPPGPESDTEENTLDMDAKMLITEMRYVYYTGTLRADCLELFEDADGDGKISLNDLETESIHNLPAPPG